MDDSTIAKLVGLQYYAWGVGFGIIVMALIILSPLLPNIFKKKRRTFNHHRNERDNLFS